MNLFSLSLKLLFRQGRSGALGLLAAGLIVATAALVSVSVFTDRVGRALDRQAGEALAADLAIASRAPDSGKLRHPGRVHGSFHRQDHFGQHRRFSSARNPC